MVDLNSESIGTSNSEVKIDVQDIVDLGQLLLRFSRVERITYHEDGERVETDSDHTVMLSVLACAIASELRPDLDIGKIAQYALIHDLVEVYAGDTPTLKITEDEKIEKQRKEAEALERITGEFSSFPWLIETMESYESLDTIEARFVKGIDKLMPIVTHLLNNGQLIKRHGMTKEQLLARYDQMIQEMGEYSGDLPEVMELRDMMAKVFVGVMFPYSHSTE